MDDSVHSAFRDMGFLAQPDGTFALRIAGGLGAARPSMGVLVEEHVNPKEVLYYVRAMVDTFCRHGNYENRAKARTRFMQDTLGARGAQGGVFEKRGVRQGGGGVWNCPGWRPWPMSAGERRRWNTPGPSGRSSRGCTR